MAGGDALAEYDFRIGGNVAHLLGPGFSHQEGEGTWMIGAISEISLPLPEQTATGNQLHFELVLLPFTAPPGLLGQPLTVEVNGRLVHHDYYSDWAYITILLPADLLGPQRDLHLTLHHPAAACPGPLGASNDARVLAFFVQRMSLRVAGENAEIVEDAAQNGMACKTASFPEVVKGLEGWLFLAGGSNDAIRYYIDATFFTTETAQLWADLIVSRASRIAGLGARYLHVVAPDKISVYPERLPFPLTNIQRSPARLVEQELAAVQQLDFLVNPLEAFFADPNRDRLYLKTDTHWSYLAGHILLGLVLQRLGYPPATPLDMSRAHHVQFIGDLGQKIAHAVSEPHFYMSMSPSVTRSYANELAELFDFNVRVGRPVVHGGINVVFTNSAPDALPERVVIFGDSFMDFQPSNPTVAFAEKFSEVHFIWSGGIDYAYIRRVKPSLVVTELTERFMQSLPTDDFDVVATCADRLREMQPLS